MSRTMVTASNVSKRFRIPTRQHYSLRGRVLHPFQGGGVRIFDALHDVSFDVAEGEFFGIVGRNGSGKSTMLKILAGIYGTDTGEVGLGGSLAPFIELGVGFNFELSARDNVYLNGALLGLTKKQLQERYDHIVEFAELEEFMELKLANFSSGMQVRLAFAIAVESDADILLIDEVLAVGDERFQRKCFDVFRARKEAGKTVVFVSHDMGAVREFCDRALLLEQGRVVSCGDAYSISQAYYRLNLPEHAERELDLDQGWIGSVGISEVDAAAPTYSEEARPIVRHGRRVRLTMDVRAREDVEVPSYGFIVNDGRGRHIIAANTAFNDTPPDPLRSGDHVTVEFEFDNFVGDGLYYVSATLEGVGLTEPVDVRRDVLDFHVESGHATGGLLQVPHAFSVRSAAAAD